MKQKVVIKVTLCNPKKCARTKVMKIAATACGVESVAIKGADKNELEVIGEGIDAVELAKSLRKNVGHADVLSVGPVKEEEKPKPQKPQKQEKPEERVPPLVCYPCYGTNTPYCQVYEVRDPCQNGCFIM